MNANRTLSSALLIALCLAVAGPAHAETDIDEETVMDPSGRVSIENVQGSVNVRGWSQSQLKLTGTLADNVERLEFEEKDGDVRIKVVLKKKSRDRSWGWGDREDDTRLEVMVPSQARLIVSGVSADINVADFEGSQRLNTVSGDIESVMGRDNADLQSVSGDVELRGTGDRYPAEVVVESVSGDVEVYDVAGELIGETVSGDLEMRSVAMSRGRMESVSGDIDLQGTLLDDGRLRMASVSGSIRIDLGDNVDARFDLETFSGDIDDFYGYEYERKSKYAPGKELRFEVGGGRGEVSISTMSGDIINDR